MNNQTNGQCDVSKSGFSNWQLAYVLILGMVVFTITPAYFLRILAVYEIQIPLQVFAFYNLACACAAICYVYAIKNDQKAKPKELPLPKKLDRTIEDKPETRTPRYQPQSSASNMENTHVSFASFQNPYLKVENKRLRDLIKTLRRRLKTNYSVPGYVYISQRSSDGVYKIGRSINVTNRMRQHKSDYGVEFKTMATFLVPNMNEFESIALSMTKRYEYKEANRQELRALGDDELAEFMDEFSKLCLQAMIFDNADVRK